MLENWQNILPDPFKLREWYSLRLSKCLKMYKTCHRGIKKALKLNRFFLLEYLFSFEPELFQIFSWFQPKNILKIFLLEDTFQLLFLRSNKCYDWLFKWHAIPLTKYIFDRISDISAFRQKHFSFTQENECGHGIRASALFLSYS